VGRSDSEEGFLELPSFDSVAKPALRSSSSGSVSVDTPEGRVAHLLSTDPTVVSALISALRRLLGSPDYVAQRDAAEAIQILSFSGDGVTQMLVNEGMLYAVVCSAVFVTCRTAFTSSYAWK
jgi:hypothetical protein